MISSILSRLVILVFGTLYPAYASYKAVRSKNVKEYVKWMMYWIVFALFTCAETFTDVLFSWFPFYYEVKIVLVLWLLSPATKGSSILYRKFVHPALCKREQEIDDYISKATEQGYHTVLNLGSKGVNYATTVIVQTAIKNLSSPNFAIQENRADTRGIQTTSQTDGATSDTLYDDIQMNYYNNNERVTPKIVEIEVDSGSDPDYYPESDDVPLLDSSSRSRGVVRKRNVKKTSKTNKDGVEVVRTTRSRTAKEKRKQSVE